MRMLGRGAHSHETLAMLEKPSLSFFAAVLAAVEISVGSVLHGFRVPFSGTLLSLFQGYFLTIVTKSTSPYEDGLHAASQVSSVAAVLKSLSPMGKKLTPMLAISAQGTLFGWAVWLFGSNLTGVIIGSMMCALWGVLQPLAILAVVARLAFSNATFERLAESYSRLVGSVAVEPFHVLKWLIIWFLIFKIVCAGLLAVHGWFFSERAFSLIQKRLIKTSPVVVVDSPIHRSAFWVFKKPFYLLPLAFTALLLWYAEHSLSAVVIGILRPIAALYLVTFLWRMYTSKISNRNWKKTRLSELTMEAQEKLKTFI